jgi:hypothetical protein
MMATCVRNLPHSICLRIGFARREKLIIPDNNTEKGYRPLAESRPRKRFDEKPGQCPRTLTVIPMVKAAGIANGR